MISPSLRLYTTFVLPVVTTDRRYPISSKNERRSKIERSQKSKFEPFLLGTSMFLSLRMYSCDWLTNATIFLKFRLQASKPIMEKRRRARINESLNELKTLILEAMKKDVSIIQRLWKNFLSFIWEFLVLFANSLKFIWCFYLITGKLKVFKTFNFCVAAKTSLAPWESYGALDVL